MYFIGVNPIKMISKDFDMFWRFYFSAGTRVMFAKIFKRKLRNPVYGGRIVRSRENANEKLKAMISDTKPFMFGRHGGNESFIAGQGIMIEKKIIDTANRSRLDRAFLQCGFFSNDDKSIVKFSKLIRESSEQCDFYGAIRCVWEDYFIKNFMRKHVIVTHTNMLDFWRFKEPFTCALKGKKVLIVHPLDELIESQYQNRKFIFQDKSWLPDFELTTVKSVQTIAGLQDERFDNWFDALDYMKSEVEKRDFEIALLGCGAYGMPLAAHIKKMGKQVIYMGVLQILFGIRGGRWDKIPEVSEKYNKYWVSPSDASIPKNADIVEGGCYW